MRVNVRYFASLREALGQGEVLEMPTGSTVATLREALQLRSTQHAQRLSHDRAVRCAVDQMVAEETTALRDNAEVAFFPPVTGG